MPRKRSIDHEACPEGVDPGIAGATKAMGALKRRQRRVFGTFAGLVQLGQQHAAEREQTSPEGSTGESEQS